MWKEELESQLASRLIKGGDRNIVPRYCGYKEAAPPTPTPPSPPGSGLKKADICIRRGRPINE